MTIERITTTIDGVEYTTQTLGFTAGRQMSVKLANMAGPHLADLARALFAGADKKAAGKGQGPGAGEIMASLGEMDAGEVLAALGAFLGRLDDRDLDEITKTLAERSTAAGQKMTPEFLEVHFSGEGLGRYFKWLVWAVGVNFSRPLSGIFANLGGGLRPPMGPA